MRAEQPTQGSRSDRNALIRTIAADDLLLLLF
jgi:hypothetical protein